MARIFVTGAGGLLGLDLCRLANRAHIVIARTRAELDVADDVELSRQLADAAPELVINCAAFTDVDGAESREGEAMLVNGQAPGWLATRAHEVGARLIHIGSDYVFAGDQASPRAEGAEVAPRSAYGRSKLAGERAIAAVGGRATVVRSSWLYGAGGRNFVDTIRNRLRQSGNPLRVVNDQIGSPTWSVSLARALLALSEVETPMVVHFSGVGAISWYDLANAIAENMGVSVTVHPQATADLGRPAPRPAYSALDTKLYRALTGLEPLAWRTALGLYLAGHDDEPAGSHPREA